MDDAGPGGHPLHVAGSEPAAMSGGILVLHLAFEHVGDRLEPPMGVIRSADRLAGRVIDRPHLVDEEERVDRVDLAGERPAHHESGALQLPVRRHHLLDFADLVLRRHDPISLRAGSFSAN